MPVKEDHPGRKTDMASILDGLRPSRSPPVDLFVAVEHTATNEDHCCCCRSRLPLSRTTDAVSSEKSLSSSKPWSAGSLVQHLRAAIGLHAACAHDSWSFVLSHSGSGRSSGSMRRGLMLRCSSCTTICAHLQDVSEASHLTCSPLFRLKFNFSLSGNRCSLC